jgi:replicative DNA helicase
MPNTYDLPVVSVPFSIEAEQSVLGAILIDQACLSAVMEYIKPESFYREVHQELYSLMVQMFTDGQTVDFITVFEKAVEKKIFDTPEDAKIYLATITQIVPTTSGVESYAKIVQEKFYTRRLMETAQSILCEIGEGNTDAKALLESAEQRLFEIQQGKAATGMVHIKESVLATYDHLQKITGDDKEKYLGIKTGFSALDRAICGLNKSDLILIAGRPGMGKTAFSVNIAQNVAKSSGKQVVIFSLEMSSEQLTARVLSSTARIPSVDFRTGNMSRDQWHNLSYAAQVVSEYPILIDDRAGITAAEMKAGLRRIKNLGLVVIDYLQLMSTGGKRTENRVQEVSDITRSLKIMAKELDVPVLVCSQLSRGPDSRTEHRPVLSDLRESGSIEQDADIVMFMYREAYYNAEADKNIAECIIAKNRHGETDNIKLHWDGQFTQFSTLESFREGEC